MAHAAFNHSAILEWKSLPFSIEALDSWGECHRSIPPARRRGAARWRRAAARSLLCGTPGLHAAAGTRLLIGTSKGQLLVYDIPNSKESGGRFKVDLKETKKTFSKK